MAESNKINILLVDDRPENLIALEAIIESDDYNLIKANSGEEALKYLLKYDFAAILLDVQMPGMDGFETAKYIKAREKSKNIPILFITANNMEAKHVFQGYSVGAVDYLIKPVDPLMLRAKVQRFVELFKMNQLLVHQAEVLSQTNDELEQAYEELQQSKQLISHMAYHDGLTDLPNKRFFNESLIHSVIQAKEKDQSLVMMYLDMDKFKQVNDSLGHLIGDRLLQEVAKRLKSSVREDDFVARIGGDEFNILLPDTNREAALELAEGLMERLKQPFYIENYELHLTASIGISVFPFDGEDPVTLMKNADAALYRAKEQGRDKYQIYHSGMNIEAYRRYTLQNDMRHAIKNNEFTLLYQPRVDIRTGKINGAEALIRWNHPNWGLLSPLEFIPLAEESGHIVQIGEWVLKAACEQSRKWQKAGKPPIRIAINFSAQQFLQKNLVSTIKRILNECELEPGLLEVELTESAIMQNEENVVKILHEMKRMGIVISLDDFGTGYSSLNYLRKFPIDIVKIDRSFVHDLPHNEKKNTAIIESIVQLAHCLNLEVIAEGVETEEQLNSVNRLKCESVQGFLYSPPVAPNKLEDMLAKGFPLKPAPLTEDNKTADLADVLDSELDRLKDSFSISARELEVFRLVLDGLNNREISEELFISEHTVKNHITRLFQKLDVNDRLQAMALVYQTCIKQNKSMLA